MVTLNETPSNLAHLNPAAFRFNIRILPGVVFFGQTANLPGVSLTPTIQTSPFANINVVGGTLEYEDLSVTFIVDENLSNWLEIFYWMEAITGPKSFEQYKTRKESNESLRIDTGDLFSSAELITLTNSKNPNMQVIFDDIFPINLSGIEFDTTHAENITVTSTVVFKYTTYKVDAVGTAATAISSST
jgi:hypothetical protein